MATIAEVLEQAKLDLGKAEQREARAREALSAAAADKERLSNFIALLTQYGGLPARDHGEQHVSQARRGRESKQGTAAIEIITARGIPIPVDPLADAIKQMGVEIGGGAKRNSYLASYLSKDPRLKFIRGKGWWVLDLGDVPDREGRRPENAEPPAEATEGSSGAGFHVNGPADREVGATLLEPPTYRMGGGGT